jgi:hypothetical protein
MEMARCGPRTEVNSILLKQIQAGHVAVASFERVEGLAIPACLRASQSAEDSTCPKRDVGRKAGRGPQP